ncbi:DegQ family serine endoprotease [Aquibaculum arenosum]|uniref:Probable periplasmic serine endoprotease DegP-like n=1 Tax=Aquibaculum arenosum TaxID=3032591 RepID=A0ABT5YMB5_9PROT|nr:DegQ family serine endoprotease [Fodinicurvata sp. CAU 1616]MDF2096103.1 DegQ family serine endoprotease [Fodinicurvata sp. CAU 1616]
MQFPSTPLFAAPSAKRSCTAGLRSALTCLALLGFILSCIAAPAQARGAPDSFADLAEELLPTVVNISTSQVVEGGGGPESFEDLFREFFERRGGESLPSLPQRRQASLGSGFIIDPDGYIVTNHHVVDGADEITVRLADNRPLAAEVIGTDDKTDLALLKVEADEPLPYARWGDSDKARVGDWVLAIGNPFGLGGTVTAGIISARQRDINAGPYDDFIQTDASINRGNSGGPTFDLDGAVIGVNTAIFSPSGGSIGIGFAIPSTMARSIIASLREYGEVRRGWLGVHLQSVTDELAEGMRLPDTEGALVASVVAGGPADEAGIEQGDVILRFNGRPVTEMRRLPRMVAETPVGESVEVVIWRRGEEVSLFVDLGLLDEEVVAALPQPREEPASEESIEDLGLTLSPITEELQERFLLEPDAAGVVVIDVAPMSPAAERGLRPGDVIAEMDQEPVTTPEEVRDHLVQAREEGYRVITLLIRRNGEYQWVALRIE